MKPKDKPRKRVRLSTILSAILVIVGVALILYPTIANRINQAANGKVIKEYHQTVEQTGDGEYEQIFTAVEEYNAELAETTPYIADLTSDRRKIYESLLNVGGNGIIGYIDIPKANVYLAIYHGTEESVLQTGIGHLEGSSLPAKGKSVHTVLTGHSGLPSARLFTDIDRLKLGDTFSVHVMRETLTYQVEDIRRVEPKDLENMLIEDGKELCTLVTCTPYGVNTHRLAVTGHRIETPETPKEKDSPITSIVSSKWNRRFVFLPPVILIAIIIIIILIRKKHKKKIRKPIYKPKAGGMKSR